MDRQPEPTESNRETVERTVETRQADTAPAAPADRADGRVIGKRVVWYIAGFIIALLAVRVVLLMLGANRASGFVDFVYSISGVFAQPFYGIFPTPSYNGQFYLDSASLVAIVVYALIAWGIARLFTLTAPRNAA